jgi:hypothetical protein
MKIILQKKQTLQQFTINIKYKLFAKVIVNGDSGKQTLYNSEKEKFDSFQI